MFKAACSQLQAHAHFAKATLVQRCMFRAEGSDAAALSATLNRAQAHMLEVSEQASLAELVAGLAEARAAFLEHACAQGDTDQDCSHEVLC